MWSNTNFTDRSQDPRNGRPSACDLFRPGSRAQSHCSHRPRHYWWWLVRLLMSWSHFYYYFFSHLFFFSSFLIQFFFPLQGVVTKLSFSKIMDAWLRKDRRFIEWQNRAESRQLSSLSHVHACLILSNTCTAKWY